MTRDRTPALSVDGTRRFVKRLRFYMPPTWERRRIAGCQRSALDAVDLVTQPVEGAARRRHVFRVSD